jgi:hypothetical protein
MSGFRAALISHRVILLCSPSYGHEPMVSAPIASNGTDQIAEKAPGPVSLIFQSMVRDVRASRKMRRCQLSRGVLSAKLRRGSRPVDNPQNKSPRQSLGRRARRLGGVR